MMISQNKQKWHGDCPTCLYTYSRKEFHSGMVLCSHPAGELFMIDGLVSNCDGWIESKE